MYEVIIEFLLRDGSVFAPAWNDGRPYVQYVGICKSDRATRPYFYERISEAERRRGEAVGVDSGDFVCTRAIFDTLHDCELAKLDMAGYSLRGMWNGVEGPIFDGVRITCQAEAGA